MFAAFLTGFTLGLSLIIAIGAQNAFVLRQGIIREHVFYIALFCSVSDSLLITLGVAGISYFFSDFISDYSSQIFTLSVFWLLAYGILRLRSALSGNMKITIDSSETNSFLNAISIAAFFTFANPHVYLDTMILIGSVSQQFEEINKVYFAIGASLASFLWFFSIAYGAKLLTPIMQKKTNWRILDLLIAIVMFIIAFNLASQSGLIN